MSSSPTFPSEIEEKIVDTYVDTIFPNDGEDIRFNARCINP